MPQKARLTQRKSPACDAKNLKLQIKYWKNKHQLLQEQCNQLWSSIHQQQQSDTSESSNDSDLSDSDDSDYIDDSDDSDDDTINIQINDEKLKHKMLLLSFKLGLKGNTSINETCNGYKTCLQSEKIIIVNKKMLWDMKRKQDGFVDAILHLEWDELIALIYELKNCILIVMNYCFYGEASWKTMFNNIESCLN